MIVNFSVDMSEEMFSKIIDMVGVKNVVSAGMSRAQPGNLEQRIIEQCKRGKSISQIHKNLKSSYLSRAGLMAELDRMIANGAIARVETRKMYRGVPIVLFKSS